MRIKGATLSEAIKVPLSPFPGLRPFEFHESHLFFGRDGQVEKLIDKLTDNRFLAVVGTSGSGKSSLVRAGLMPTLVGGMMPSAGSKWRIAVMRPGNDPIGSLALSMNQPEVFGSNDQENTAIQVAVAEATLRRGSRGLIEAVRQTGMPDDQYLLVVVDQFEELFRFTREASRKTKEDSDRYQNDAAAFVKLLLEARGQREVNIFVVLTMRSDFLGDCAAFWDLPEAINESQYLIPRLTRDQLREVITGPVVLGGGEITTRMITQLLNAIGDNQDQLPVLQHLLMQVWDEWKEKRIRIETGNDQGTVAQTHSQVHAGAAIDLCCYQAVGGMAEALSRHADEAYNELPDDRHRGIAEKLFKCLTERGEDNREIRRPVTLGEICAAAETSASDVKSVVETFRLPGRSFLMPPSGSTLNNNSLIDISHESLIRGWRRLNTWVDEEARSARVYRRLAETAELHREGKAGLWGDPDLQVALDWRETNKPNDAWATRYNAGFETAMAFLQASEQKRSDDQAELERRQLAEIEYAQRELEQARALAEAQQQHAESESQRAQEQSKRLEEQAKSASRLRRLIVLLAVIVLFALVAAVFAFSAYRRAEIERGRAESNKTKSRQLYYAANMNLAQQAYAAHDMTRVDELLNAHLPAANAPGEDDIRGFYWFYLWRNSDKEMATLEGHAGAVSSVAFSSDGRTLASGGLDNTVKLWDARTGKEIATLKGHPGDVTSVAFSSDGKTLASASDDNMVKLWDVRSAQEVATLQGHVATVYSVAFSSDGKTLASGSGDRTVKLWDLSGRKEIKTINGHSGAVRSVAFSPDGKTLAIGGGDNAVKLLDVLSGREVAVLKGHSGGVRSVAFSPDGNLLASGSGDNTVKLWDVRLRREAATYKGHVASVWSVAFSTDGKTLASGSGDNTVKLWDLASGQEVATLKAYAATVYSVSFSSDGKTLASGSSDNTVKLWDVRNQREEPTLKGHADRVRSVAFSSDGKTLASGSVDHTVKLWDTQSGQEMATLRGHADPVNSVAFSPDGKTVASGSSDGTVKLWHMQSQQEVATLKGHADLVWSVVFSPDGKTLASGSKDNAIKLWDVSTGQEIATLNGHAGDVNSVAFSPDGKLLASGSKDRTVKLWDVQRRQEVATLKGHLGAILSVAFSSDGKMLASGSGDNTVKLWNAQSREEVATLKGHASSVNSVAFSPDGKTLASGSLDNMVMLWGAWSGQEVAILKGHSDSVWSVAFSSDGRMLATASSDKTVKVWLAATDEEVTAFKHK